LDCPSETLPASLGIEASHVTPSTQAKTMNKTKLLISLLLSLLVVGWGSLCYADQALSDKEQTIDSYIEQLNDEDLLVVMRAVNELGRLKDRRAIPALTKLLESDRDLVSMMHHKSMTDDKGLELWDYIVVNVRDDIMRAMVAIGDLSVVPTLEQFLVPPKNALMNNPVNAAVYLYRLTGKAYEYEDLEGKTHTFKWPQEQTQSD